MWDRYDPRSSNDRDRNDFGERNRGSRGGSNERDHAAERDPRDVFMKDLDLPRGRERRPVRERDRVYEINGNERRMLATVGAFRVVSESDLQDPRDDSNNPRSVRHLKRERLIRTSQLSSDDRAVVLTDRGRGLLEAHRYERDDRVHEPRQTFWAGLRKPRELTHDTKVYRAYRRAEERLRGQGGSVRRVVLDYELKRDYQRFLHERNRGKKDCDGRPDREPHEIAQWAREHDLPYDDGHVHFPDARIEYEDRDGLSRHKDIEIVTGHYRGAHAGAVAKVSAAIERSAAWSADARAPEGEEVQGIRDSQRSCWDEPAVSARPMDRRTEERRAPRRHCVVRLHRAPGALSAAGAAAFRCLRRTAVPAASPASYMVRRAPTSSRHSSNVGSLRPSSLANFIVDACSMCTTNRSGQPSESLTTAFEKQRLRVG